MSRYKPYLHIPRGLQFAGVNKPLPDPSTVAYGMGWVDESGDVHICTYKHQISSIARFVNSSKIRRVDIAGIGDSNMWYNSYGWHNGLIKAIVNNAYLYSTPMFGGYLKDSTTYLMNISGGSAWLTPPAEYSEYDYGDVGRTYGISSTLLPMNVEVGPDSTSWMELTPGLLDQSAGFEYSAKLGGFDSGAGTFAPYIRNQTDSSIIVGYTTINVNNEHGIYEYSKSFSNNLTGKTVRFGLGNIGSKVITDKFYALTQRVISNASQIGIAFSTIGYRPSMSTRVMAQAWVDLDTDAKDFILATLVEKQNDTPMLLIRINEGANDIADTTISVNGVSNSNTYAGYKDNLTTIISEMRNSWARLGFNSGDLFFLISPTHVMDSSDAGMGVIREASLDVSKEYQNVGYYDVTKNYEYQDMVDGSFYASGGNAHLSTGGYDSLSESEFTDVFNLEKIWISP